MYDPNLGYYDDSDEECDEFSYYEDCKNYEDHLFLLPDDIYYNILNQLPLNDLQAFSQTSTLNRDKRLKNKFLNDKFTSASYEAKQAYSFLCNSKLNTGIMLNTKDDTITFKIYYNLIKDTNFIFFNNYRHLYEDVQSELRHLSQTFVLGVEILRRKNNMYQVIFHNTKSLSNIYALSAICHLNSKDSNDLKYFLTQLFYNNLVTNYCTC